MKPLFDWIDIGSTNKSDGEWKWEIKLLDKEARRRSESLEQVPYKSSFIPVSNQYLDKINQLRQATHKRPIMKINEDHLSPYDANFPSYISENSQRQRASSDPQRHSVDYPE